MSKNTRSALIGLLLCLPGAIMFTLLVLGIEPPLGPLRPLVEDGDPESPDVVGSLLVLFFVVVLPGVALFLNLRPLAQLRRAGGHILDQPSRLAVSVVAFVLIAAFIGAIVIDQYSCWMGVPNCD